MILITGATGFLGGHIVKNIAEKRNDIRILAVDYENAKMMYPNFEVVRGDIVTKDGLEEACKDVDTVVHLAGMVSYSASKKLISMINYEGTKNLLEACVRAGRFIFSSSVSVYGEIKPGDIADEEYQRNPMNPYGLSKLEAEEEIINSGIPYVIFRIAPVYGRGSPQWMKNLGMLEKGFPIPKTENMTHIVHVSNLAHAFGQSLRGDTGIFNIADPKPVKFVDLAESLVTLLGKKPRRLPVWMVKAFAFALRKEKYIDVLTMNRNYDITRAMKKLDYMPDDNMSQWLKEMVEWYRTR
ncbi:MAG: NAD(P)-dependent oxidoreductase [Candidatus Aenigmarchaeota archaeon]|nr:NAD(P)-dependent oxidoreductase [Candidatus Aenigmarchaeota archaeon]